MIQPVVASDARAGISPVRLQILEFSSESDLRTSQAHASKLASEDLLILHRKRLDVQVRCQSRRYLRFNECCEWVRRNHGFQTQDEWNEWVGMGEGLTPYIPTRPDEFFSRLGQWRGWDYFLLGIVNSSDDPRY